MTQTVETEPIGKEVILPTTGELIPLDGPSDQLAEAVLKMRELERELAYVRTTVGKELARRLDLENMRSASVGDYKVSVAAPSAEWNVDALAGVLDGLVEEDALTPGAMDRIVKLERKLDKRELNKLLATLSPEHQERVRACSKPTDRARIASVSYKTKGVPV